MSNENLNIMSKECKKFIDNTVNSPEMEECLNILGEMDKSASIGQIKEAVTRIEEALPYLQSIRNKYGEINSGKILALSSNISEYEFFSDVNDIIEKTDKFLDNKDYLKIQDALTAVAHLHFSGGDKENIDEYIDLVKGTLDNCIDEDLEKIIDDNLENLREFAKADILDEDNDVFKEIQERIEEEYRKTLEEETRKFIEEQQTREAEAAMERSNRFHEILNEIEDKIKKHFSDTLLFIKHIVLEENGPEKKDMDKDKEDEKDYNKDTEKNKDDGIEL